MTARWYRPPLRIFQIYHKCVFSKHSAHGISACMERFSPITLFNHQSGGHSRTSTRICAGYSDICTYTYIRSQRVNLSLVKYLAAYFPSFSQSTDAYERIFYLNFYIRSNSIIASSVHSFHVRLSVLIYRNTYITVYIRGYNNARHTRDYDERLSVTINTIHYKYKVYTCVRYEPPSSSL